MTESSPGLRCVISWSDKRYLCSIVSDELKRLAGTEEVRDAGEQVCIVNTALPAESLRDHLSPLLQEGETLLVLDFETWSAFGPGIDSGWMLRRGH